MSEKKAESLHRQGAGYAKHLGVRTGSDRWRRIVYGTKRSGGWKPSREARARAASGALRRGY